MFPELNLSFGRAEDGGGREEGEEERDEEEVDQEVVQGVGQAQGGGQAAGGGTGRGELIQWSHFEGRKCSIITHMEKYSLVRKSSISVCHA